MEFRKLGKSDLNVSAVGLGTWAIGDDYWGPADDAESIKALQAGIDSGINLIDTAPAYGGGHSEKIVGQAVRGRRDKVILATKVGVIRKQDGFLRTLNLESMKKQLEESLKLLQTDVIDLYQIHWPVKEDSEEDALELMTKMQKEGKIRYIGVSNFDVPLLERGLKAAERDKPTAHAAINWSIRQKGITCALVGARNEKQAKSNAAAAEWSLSEEELSRIDAAHGKYIAGNF